MRYDLSNLNLNLIMKKTLLIAALYILSSQLLWATPTPNDIVRKADTFRGYLNSSFKMVISIASYRKDRKTQKTQMAVQVKAGKSLVNFLAPKRDKGRAMLFAGKNLWLKIPKTRKIIRISPAQRLMGEASNGDVAGTNFFDDYTPTLIGEETVDNMPCYHLSLKAKDRKVTYAKLEYWVSIATGKPVKSEHYAISGKLLKIAFYKKYSQHDGGEKLSKLLLVNPLIKGSYTWMSYGKYQQIEIPDSQFRKENLNRL
jgi:hypothetical protein